jgi:hypothetical protein
MSRTSILFCAVALCVSTVIAGLLAYSFLIFGPSRTLEAGPLYVFVAVAVIVLPLASLAFALAIHSTKSNYVIGMVNLAAMVMYLLFSFGVFWEYM